MQKHTLKIALLSLSLSFFLTSCAQTNSTIEAVTENYNISVNDFSISHFEGDALCSPQANSYSEIEYSALRKGIGDTHNVKGIGDTHNAKGIGDTHNVKGIGDTHNRSSIQFQDSLVFIAESGVVQSKENITCANYAASMEIQVNSGADSVLVAAGDLIVSASVIDGIAQIHIALEDLKATSIDIEDVESGEILSIAFEGK